MPVEIQTASFERAKTLLNGSLLLTQDSNKTKADNMIGYLCRENDALRQELIKAWEIIDRIESKASRKSNEASKKIFSCFGYFS